jgi:hypothetical protein
MDLLSKAQFDALLSSGETPCVSIYLPTHPGGSEQDRIRWKNVLAKAEERLATAAGLSSSRAKAFLRPAYALSEDATFWKHASDGLAYFLSPGKAHAFRLPEAFSERVNVGERFQIKPLLPLLSDTARFYLLALSQNQVRLWHCSAQKCEEVELRGVPKNIAEALRSHDADEPLVFHTHPATGLGRSGTIFHGHGVGIDDAKDDLLHYFQLIDRGLHHYLREETAPLVLAGVEYLWPLYREANTYPHLCEGGVAGNADESNIRELYSRARKRVKPNFAESLTKALALYAQLAGTGRTSNDVGGLVSEAQRGAVEVLFVGLDREVWGTWNGTSSDVAVHAKAQTGDEELLNRAAIDVLAHGGAVHVVPAAEMPDGAPLAGIYWLPEHGKKR